MKNRLLKTCIPLLAVLLAGCYKTIEKMGNDSNAVVLAYPAAKFYNVASSGLNYWNKALLTLDMSKESVVVPVSINIAQPLDKSIPITIGVDQAAFDAYNSDTANHAKYALMPEAYYKIENATVSLPAGKTDTTFNVIFYPSKFDISATGYLLPISIITDPGVPVSQEMKTVYFHVEKDPFPPYSRTGWTVTGMSSEEASGEGPNNGRVVHLLDNDPSTFWHSQWQGGTPGPPHWFSFDMGTANVLNGVMFLDRQCGCTNRPKDVTISVSTDNVTWTDAATLNLANTTSWQKFTFGTPLQAARYLKVTITGMYDAQTYTNLAEFKVF